MAGQVEPVGAVLPNSFNDNSMARGTRALELFPNLWCPWFQTCPKQDSKLRLRGSSCTL